MTNSPKRSYADACATAHGLDLVGERWAILVLRELMLGPRRFGELRADLPGISANVLTQRLEGLEQSGLLRRRQLAPPASVQVYELTPWGQEFEQVILAFGRWALRSPHHDPTLPLSPVALMLSFRTKFDPQRAGELAAALRFSFDDAPYAVSVRDGVLSIERGPGEPAEVEITGTPPAVAGLVYGKVPLAELERQGALTVSGDRRVLRRFASLFELPPKAPPGASAR